MTCTLSPRARADLVEIGEKGNGEKGNVPFS